MKFSQFQSVFPVICIFTDLDVQAGFMGGNRNVTESDGFITVCIELDHSPLASVQVTLSTLPDTAVGK